MNTRWHYTHPYLIDPEHPVTVNLAGLGGTGSSVLTSLAKIDTGLNHLGHPGLFVRCFDDDIVSEANMGRQTFYESDIGHHKAVILVTRINRAFGLTWQAHPTKFSKDLEKELKFANITITCVDSGTERKKIYDVLTHKQRGLNPFETPYYALDFGNDLAIGQAILGTLTKIKQPSDAKKAQSQLPHILDICPDIDLHDDGDVTPSCSVVEALSKQELFINSNLATFGMNLIWKLFRESRICWRGIYMSLSKMKVSPIPV